MLLRFKRLARDRHGQIRSTSVSTWTGLCTSPDGPPSYVSCGTVKLFRRGGTKKEGECQVSWCRAVLHDCDTPWGYVVELSVDTKRRMTER